MGADTDAEKGLLDVWRAELSLWLETVRGETGDTLPSWVEALPFPAWANRLDADGRCRLLWMNRACKREFYLELDAIGRTVEEAWPAEVAGQLMKTDAEVLRTGAPVRVLESVPSNCCERMRHYWVVKYPVHGPGGAIAQVGGLAIPRLR